MRIASERFLLPNDDEASVYREIQHRKAFLVYTWHLFQMPPFYESQTLMLADVAGLLNVPLDARIQRGLFAENHNHHPLFFLLKDPCTLVNAISLPTGCAGFLGKYLVLLIFLRTYFR